MSDTKELSVDRLLQAAYELIPWWSDFSIEADFKIKTLEYASGVNEFYLFPLTELTVNNDIEDIPKFINERYRTILSAAYTSGISVATIISSKAGQTRILLGFKKDGGNPEKDGGNPEKDGEKYELFQSMLNGIFPGKKIEYKERLEMSSLVKDFYIGGMVTGIPTLKNDDEKQQFNLASVIRSLYGKEYALVITATPVQKPDLQDAFSKLIALRDELHAMAKMTIGEEKGIGTATAINEQKTTSTSKTTGHNFGGAVGTGFLTPFGPIGGGFNYSHSRSNTNTNSTTKGKTETFSENHNTSISVERQNGIALELEKIAGHLVERMMQGFNSGYWETAITFATKDKLACDILGGSFTGEFAKPNDKFLPPPRLYMDTIGQNQMLFLPKADSDNSIFPKSLASYITSEELSQIASPPTESLPGYEIKKMPALALTDTVANGEIALGKIADHGSSIENSFITLSKRDLNKHLFVCGITGSGKTTTVKHILKNLCQNENVPFLILESAKRDYRQLLADDVFKDRLNIFTIGDATVSPIRLNPFYIQKGVHPLVHIDYLKAIFNASFSLYGPMPHIVEKCLHNIYLKRGWNLTTSTHPNFLNAKGENDLSGAGYAQPEHHYCFPTLLDLKNEVDNYVKNELEYKGELRDNIRTAIIARLESLCVGAKGLMFNTCDFYPLEKILNNNTIFEMESLVDDDDKAFFVGLMLVLISEYRQKANPAINPGQKDKGLQHFLVIEEAHRLLKNVATERTSEMMGNPKGKAVEVFCNVIAEMRSLGQGVAVVEQIPTKISPDVIKNANTKIVHRLVAKDDQSLLAGSLSISEDDALYLNRLKTGHALCHKEGMERPVECHVIKDVKLHGISDDNIRSLMTKQNNTAIHSFEAYELAALLKNDGKELAVRFLNSLCTVSANNVEELKRSAIKELQRLLLLHNIHWRFNEGIFADYLLNQIFDLLSKGIYCKQRGFPKALKQTLFSLLTSPESKYHEMILQLLKEYWVFPEASSYILEAIEHLSIKYLLQQQRALTKVDITSTINSFFMEPNEQVVEKITKRVIDKYGVDNG